MSIQETLSKYVDLKIKIRNNMDCHYVSFNPCLVKKMCNLRFENGRACNFVKYTHFKRAKKCEKSREIT